MKLGIITILLKINESDAHNKNLSVATLIQSSN